LSYAKGEGVLKNLTQAKHWMQKVYDGDDKEAAARAEKAWEAFELWKY
jgi:TPR repeat protein